MKNNNNSLKKDILLDKVSFAAKKLCLKYNVKRLGVFGSVARKTDSSASDIDLFAEFDNPTPENMPERYFGFLQEAKRALGREIQLLTPKMVRNPFLIKSIKRDMVIIYG